MNPILVDRFMPLGSPSRWARGFMLATLLVAAIAAVSGLIQTELLVRAKAGAVTQIEAEANDARGRVITFARLAVLVPTAISFLVWFYYSYKNLASIGIESTFYSPAWAVGSFFVPFLNLLRPVQIMREIWEDSNPEIRKAPIGTDKTFPPIVVRLWWVTFLVATIGENIANRLARGADKSLDVYIAASVLVVFSNSIEILSALLAMKLIRDISVWQKDLRSGSVST